MEIGVAQVPHEAEFGNKLPILYEKEIDGDRDIMSSEATSVPLGASVSFPISVKVENRARRTSVADDDEIAKRKEIFSKIKEMCSTRNHKRGTRSSSYE